jgi:putative membrane protein
MQKPDKQETERLLILCVDRDNDIGRRAGVRTPILGKEANMKSALKLVLADPEEADANAMFEAIRIYDDLGKDKTTHDLYQIATIAGSELGGVTADRKLVSELTDILERFQADGLILVTDGFADEDILPLIQSRVPVTSVRRVVVKHSESIEETAAVFTRYLRMLIEDPNYSKIALGLPGLLLIALGTLVLVHVLTQFEDFYTWTAIVGLIIIGSYLLGRGYRLDRKISSLVSRASHASVSELVTGFSLITGLLLIGIGFFQAGSYISSEYGIVIQFPIEIGKLLELLPQIIGWLISKSLNLVVVGVCVVFIGRSVGYILDRNSRFWRTSALVIICAWSWVIFNELSKIIIEPATTPDELVVYIIIGIILIVASGFSTRFLGKRFQETFKEKLGRKRRNGRNRGS